MIPIVPFREFIESDRFAGRAFADPSWTPMKTILIAAVGEELYPNERDLFRKLTGLEREPGVRVEELWPILGRRSGKGRGGSSLCCWHGFAMSYPELAPGERAEISCIAVSQFQAARIMGYCDGLIRNSPTMAAMVERQTPTEIETSTGALILVESNSWRSGRGGSSPLCIVGGTPGLKSNSMIRSKIVLAVAHWLKRLYLRFRASIGLRAPRRMSPNGVMTGV
jgi:hypothetical protein